MLRQYHIRDYDFKLILLVSALTVIGILAIGSAASESLQTKQTMGFVLGLFLMLVISLFDYSVILRFYWLIYLLNIALLVLVRLIGVEVNGARRWVNILGIQFQPSETAKIMILLFFAQLILRHREQMHSFKMVGMCVILFLPPIALIYEQPDLSTSIMIGLLFCVILLVGGISWKFIIGAISVALPAFVILLMLILQPEQEIINDFQQKRILAWIYPDEYADTTAYQQNNSVVAIGSGMLYGKGYKTNEISSVKNGNFISEPETDFIFAVIGEEFGFRRRLYCNCVIDFNHFTTSTWQLRITSSAALCFSSVSPAHKSLCTIICASLNAPIIASTFDTTQMSVQVPQNSTPRASRKLFECQHTNSFQRKRLVC